MRKFHRNRLFFFRETPEGIRNKDSIEKYVGYNLLGNCRGFGSLIPFGLIRVRAPSSIVLICPLCLELELELEPELEAELKAELELELIQTQ